MSAWFPHPSGLLLPVPPTHEAAGGTVGQSPGQGSLKHGDVLMLTQSNRINGCFAKQTQLSVQGGRRRSAQGQGPGKPGPHWSHCLALGGSQRWQPHSWEQGTTPRPQRSPMDCVLPRVSGGQRGRSEITVSCNSLLIWKPSEPCLPPQTRVDTAPSEFFLVVRPGRSGTGSGPLAPLLGLTEALAHALF